MKLRKYLSSISIFLMFVASTFAQTTHVRSSDSISTVAVHHRAPTVDVDGTLQAIKADVNHHNMVEKVARHCARYVKADGSIDSDACNADPSTVFWRESTHNLLTNAGKDAIASQEGNTATQAAACNFIALTNTAVTPAVTDTTLSGEITLNGLARAQGTYAHTASTATYTITKQFTATATQASQAAGIFNAASTGTLCFENTYTPVTLNNTDTLTVTWTITLSKLFLVPMPEQLISAPIMELSTAA